MRRGFFRANALELLGLARLVDECKVFAPIITTDRLTLRPPQITDARAMFLRFASDPVASRYLLWKTHASIEQTTAFLSRKIEKTAATYGGRWLICQRDGSPWGSIAAPVENSTAEIGYMLSPQLWGKGLMTEALKAVSAELWRHDSIRRIQALCHDENAASIRVLEKCGFKREGVARRAAIMPQISPVPQDCYIYVQVGH